LLLENSLCSTIEIIQRSLMSVQPWGKEIQRDIVTKLGALRLAEDAHSAAAELLDASIVRDVYISYPF
jgi:hypothetical protein